MKFTVDAPAQLLNGKIFTAVKARFLVIQGSQHRRRTPGERGGFLVEQHSDSELTVERL